MAAPWTHARRPLEGRAEDDLPEGDRRIEPDLDRRGHRIARPDDHVERHGLGQGRQVVGSPPIPGRTAPTGSGPSSGTVDRERVAQRVHPGGGIGERPRCRRGRHGELHQPAHGVGQLLATASAPGAAGGAGTTRGSASAIVPGASAIGRRRTGRRGRRGSRAPPGPRIGTRTGPAARPRRRRDRRSARAWPRSGSCRRAPPGSGPGPARRPRTARRSSGKASPSPEPPTGIHPSPYSAMAAKLPGVAAPPSRTGTRAAAPASGQL